MLVTEGDRIGGHELDVEAPTLRDAWRDVFGGPLPADVERLQAKKRSLVYRLRRDGAGGVIAKHGLGRTMEQEVSIYEGLLPSSGLDAPTLHGWVRDAQPTDRDGRTHWLFLEDLGSRRHDPKSAAERHRLAHWLGTLAAVAVHDEVGNRALPVRRTAYYGMFLQSALSELEDTISARTLGAAVRRSAGIVRRDLDTVAANWRELEDRLESPPVSVAHGDCLYKNIHVRGDGAVIPIDWGSVGLGFLGADLGVAAIQWTGERRIEPDADTYARTIATSVPGVTGTQISKMASLGQIVYLVKLLSQSVSTFRDAPPHKVADLVPRYQRALTAAVVGTGWKR